MNNNNLYQLLYIQCDKIKTKNNFISITSNKSNSLKNIGTHLLKNEKHNYNYNIITDDEKKSILVKYDTVVNNNDNGVSEILHIVYYDIIDYKNNEKLKKIFLETVYENTLLIAILNNLLLKHNAPCYLEILYGHDLDLAIEAINKACETINNFGFEVPIYLMTPD